MVLPSLTTGPDTTGAAVCWAVAALEIAAASRGAVVSHSIRCIDIPLLFEPALLGGGSVCDLRSINRPTVRSIGQRFDECRASAHERRHLRWKWRALSTAVEARHPRRSGIAGAGLAATPAEALL